GRTTTPTRARITAPPWATTLTPVPRPPSGRLTTPRPAPRRHGGRPITPTQGATGPARMPPIHLPARRKRAGAITTPTPEPPPTSRGLKTLTQKRALTITATADSREMGGKGANGVSNELT